jgi:hypothetical protein
MFIAYAVVAAVLSAILLASGYAKLTRKKQVVDSLVPLGVPLRMFPFLASCEIAGAAGLLVGLGWGPLGIAAGVGLVLYFVGATAAHLRKGDVKGAPIPAVILVAAIAVLVLRAGTL